MRTNRGLRGTVSAAGDRLFLCALWGGIYRKASAGAQAGDFVIHLRVLVLAFACKFLFGKHHVLFVGCMLAPLSSVLLTTLYAFVHQRTLGLKPQNVKHTGVGV